MKTHFPRWLILTATLASLLATPSHAAAPAKPDPAFTHWVGSVERHGHTLFTRGSSISHVERSLGAPCRKLSPDVWVYTNFYGESRKFEKPVRGDDSSTLLVTFTNGRVSDLALVNARAEGIIAARLRASVSEKTQIAAK